MTPPSLSLLVLAWDDTDPGAHPATAPVTLPVLRQLAVHQPLLAMLPELPAEVQTAGYQAEVAVYEAATALAVAPNRSTVSGTTEAIAAPPAAPHALPGTVLLPQTAAEEGVTTSRIVGLADLGYPSVTSAATAPLPEAENNAPLTPLAILASPAPRESVFQGNAALPPALATFIHTAPRRAAPWAAPAAPYLGSSLSPSPPETIGSAEAAALQDVTANALPVEPPAAPEGAGAPVPLATLPGPGAAVSSVPPLPAATPPAANEAATTTAFLPLQIAVPKEALPPHQPAPPPARDAFAQTAAEVGPEEAADLYAPEDNLTLAPEEADSRLIAPVLPAAPERASLSQALHSLHRPAPEPGPELPPAIDLTADLTMPEPLAAPAASSMPLSDNLHYRIIQYARFATHVAGEQAEQFGAIYAPNWPTWLAALEIRYRSRRPLVLHLTELAAATAAPAERGWRLELERYALRRAHTILVATDALRRQLLRHYGHLPGHLRVIAPDDEASINAILTRVGAVADF